MVLKLIILTFFSLFGIVLKSLNFGTANYYTTTATIFTSTH